MNDEITFKLIPDVSIEKEDEDKFSHSAFVEWLILALDSSENSINIGLFGKWGTGKTGILKLFESKIHSKYKDKFHYCYVDCWKLSPESMRQQLLISINNIYKILSEEKIRNQLYNITENIEESSIDEKLNNKVGRLLKQSLPLLGLSSIFLIAGAVLEFTYPDKNMFSTVGSLFFIPLVVELARKIADNSNAKLKSTKQVIPPIQSPVEFEKMFDYIISKKDDRKLVIALDNLDRCEGDLVVEMLSLVKSFMEKKGVFFVVPCDDRAIVEHLKKQRGFDREETATDFLRKFFQASVAIPPIIPSLMVEYIEELVQKYNIPANEKVQYVISIALMDNPRRIKQFLNHYIANYHLALEMEKKFIHKGTITSKPEFLAKILVLRDQFPDFYESLTKEENLLEHVEKHFRNETISDFSQGELETILKNTDLREFLKQTRRIQVNDVKPFIRLAQEPHEKSDMYDEIRNKIRIGDYNTLNEIIESKPDKLEEFLPVIQNTINEDFRKGRYEFGANGLDIILHIHKIMPEFWKNKLVELFGIQASSSKEILNKIHLYDKQLVFQFISEMKDIWHRNTILETYCDVFSSLSEYNEELLDLIIQHHDIMSSKAKEVFRESMAKFYDARETEAITTINQKFTEPHLIQLLDKKIIDKILGKMTEDVSDINKKRVSTYLQLKQVSDEGLRNYFVKRLLAIMSKAKAPQIDANVNFVVQTLVELGPDDVPKTGMVQICEQLTKFESQVPDQNQKNILIRPILKHFDRLPDPIKTKFVNEKLQEYIHWQDPPLAELFKSMELSQQDFLEYENIFSVLFNKTKQNAIPTIFEYLIKNTKDKQRELLIDVIHSHVKNQNESIRNQTLSVIKKTCKDLPEINDLVPTIIQASKRHPSPHKDNMINLLAKIFAFVSDETRDSIISEFIGLIKDPTLGNLVQNNLITIWPNLDESRKSHIWNELTSVLEKSSFNEQVKPTLNFLIDSNHFDNNYEGKINSILITQLESTQDPSKIIALQYLNKLGDLIQLDKDVIQKVEELEIGSNDNLRNMKNNFIKKYSKS